MAPSDDSTDHLGQRNEDLYWDWSRENPVEIVLVIFILVLFFTVPRTGCGIDKAEGEFPTRGTSETAQRAQPGNS